MEKILVSACLFGGQIVRYDAGEVPCEDERFTRWKQEGRLVPICPEVVGGLPTPRPDAQIVGERVLTGAGKDVTAEFERGAQLALQLAQRHHARIAILKQDSPSCGTLEVYDGTFTDRKRPGMGRTAALLASHGIAVFGEDQLAQAQQALQRLEAAAPH